MDTFFPLDQIEDFEGEVWKTIRGYDDKYYISNYGRVKSYYRKKEIILKTSLNSKGYPRVALSKKGKRQYYLVHRLVAIAFVHNDDPLNKTTVDHINQNKEDAYYQNLRWLSLSDNIKAYYEHKQQEKPKDEEILSSV